MNELSDRIGQLSPLKRALLAIEELQAKVESLEQQQHEPIAVIGLGCRFPGAVNPLEFWKLLQNGVDAIQEVPADRWSNEIFYDPTPGTPGKVITRYGGFLDQVDQFDPLFFGISPREAARMDPQQRLLLEVAWEAFENAGQPVDKLSGSKTGVFIGISNNDYSIFQYTDLNQVDAYAGTGNAFSIAANRLSYTYNLHGPSIAIDTACSSALVAVHLAVKSLRQRESNLAVAGGVNLILSPELTITFSQAHMMSADGRCKSFDASADGYGRGEGCGIVVLKRLQEALQDGDEILAVIYGTAVNQDGRSNGLTAPNSFTQQAVIQEAFQDAGISAGQIDYIEAHGTGTILGDPIEARALGSALHGRSVEKPCLVGSVKTNIGHLESASGIAGLIKVILSLNYSEIPANLHYKEINPYIDLKNTSLSIPTQLTSWERIPGKARYAGVNSFGFGGTNAHIILGDAPLAASAIPASVAADVPGEANFNKPATADDRDLGPATEKIKILTVSAKSEAALVELVRRYFDLFVEWRPKISPTDEDRALDLICQTTNKRRSHLDYRFAVRVDTFADLIEKLAFFLSENTPQIQSIMLGVNRAVLPTHDSQADAPLHDDRMTPERSLFIGLRQASGKPALAFLFPGEGLAYIGMGKRLYETQPVYRAAQDQCIKLLASNNPDVLFSLHLETNSNQYVQAGAPLLALFVTEYALAQMWISFGIRPDYVFGIGVGEYVAACLAGVFRLEDALKLVEFRGRLLEISADISNAANPVYAEFLSYTEKIDYHPANIGFVSSITGTLLDKAPNALYWREQISAIGMLHQGMQTLGSAGVRYFLESGPQGDWSDLGKISLPDTRTARFASLNRSLPDTMILSECIAGLYVAGFPLDWQAIIPSQPEKLASRWLQPSQSALEMTLFDLPTYPFQRERYWFDGIDSQDRMRLRSSECDEDAEDANPDRINTINLEHSRQDPIREISSERILDAPPQERSALLEKILREQLGRVLRMDADRINRELGLDRPIQYLGLDSIMAIELMNLIERSLKIHLPIATFLKGPTISSLAMQILALMETPQIKPGQLGANQFLGSEGIDLVELIGSEQDRESGVKIFPLSYGQRAMWFQHQMAPESVFNPVNVVKIHSPIDVVKLNHTIQLLADRHPSLRTTFISHDGEPYQRVRPKTDPSSTILFHQIDATLWNEETLHSHIHQEVDHNFDLENGPLFRVMLFTMAPEEHILLLAAHHIITDLWSMAILISELAAIYSNPVVSNQALKTQELNYQDYVAWQKDLLSGPAGEHLWSYWSEKLKGELPALDLPTDRPRPSIQTYHGASRSVMLSVELTQRLQQLSENSGVTLYMALLAAFKVLLYRYSGQEDLIVGAPTTGRDHAGLDEIVGYFVNPIALRTNLKPDLKFNEYLQQVSQTVVEALDHQDYPFALLVEKLKPERDPSRLPISQVMFILQRAQQSSQTGVVDQAGLSQFAVSMDGLRMDLAGLQVESLSLEIQKAQMDLTLIMAEVQGGLGASLTYNTDLYNAETIERLLRHFTTLLEGIVTNPEQKLGYIPLLNQKEYDQIVIEFNRTQEIIWPEIYDPISENGTGRDAGLCVHRIFEAQVQKTPQAPAVVFVDNKQQTSLTYDELNRKANRLAHYLQALGVGPDTIVGVCVERSLDMIIGLLAILKAGGAYLPMDPSSPTDRLAFMIQDARIEVLLSQSHLVEKLPTISAQLIYLDRNWENMVREILARIEKDAPQGLLEENPISDVEAHNLAYVIYTSGSTGRSKGVLLEHLGLSNLVWAQIRAFRITPRSRELQFASFSFDASLSEIFTALLGGARLYLTRREILLSIPDLIKYFQDQEISVVTLPPSVLAMMPTLASEELPHLKTIVSAGEALTPEIALRWAPGRIFLNAYGPTESTIGPTYFEIDGSNTDQEELSEQLKVHSGLSHRHEFISNTVPIGRPIANVRIYLLDKLKQPVPIGMAGEIYIAGFGVARGYLNRPELTAEKFLKNPLTDQERNSIPVGDRLYRTGDLARWLPDGSIEFLGRVDYQVKLRGFRIELEEIETILSQHEYIQQSVVLVRGNQPENRRLVAYVVPESGMPLSFNDLRGYLRQYLPDYMIPSIFVIMDAFPLTTSGKVDRKALPDVNGTRPDLEAAYVPPQTEVERIIAKIWQEVLNVEKVGLNDNFFDLGGHSLLMFKAHTRLQEAFSRTFSMVELFRYPTVSTLSEFLGKDSQAQQEAQSLQKSQERAEQQKDALKRQVDRMRELANTRAAAAKQAAMKRVNQPGRGGPGKPGASQ